jgi:hypothetical protein
MTLTQDQIEKLIPRIKKMKHARKPYIRRHLAGEVIRHVRVMILRKQNGCAVRIERTLMIQL